MKLQLVLFSCFLSALQDGSFRFVGAVDVFAGAEGGNGSILCQPIRADTSVNTKFFCKAECEEGNILVKTDEVSAQSGRYSVTYNERSAVKSVTMTITQVIKSDSGRYRFGLGGSLGPNSYCDVDVVVLDEATLDANDRFIRAEHEGGNITYPCLHGSSVTRRKFFCKNSCKKEEDILVETEENTAQSGRYGIEYKASDNGLYVTFTQVKKSDTGQYMCGYGAPLSPESHKTFPIFVADDPSASKPTTQSFTSSSGSFTPSSSETTEQSPGDSIFSFTPSPTETTEQSPGDSIFSFTPSSSETTEQSPGDSIFSFTPSPTETIEQSPGDSIFSSGSFTPSSSEEQIPVSIVHHPVFWTLVVCLIVVVLAAVLLLYKLKKGIKYSLNSRETSDSRNAKVDVSYKNYPPGSMDEDYVNLYPGSCDQD